MKWKLYSNSITIQKENLYGDYGGERLWRCYNYCDYTNYKCIASHSISILEIMFFNVLRNTGWQVVILA